MNLHEKQALYKALQREVDTLIQLNSRAKKYKTMSRLATQIHVRREKLKQLKQEIEGAGGVLPVSGVAETERRLPAAHVVSEPAANPAEALDSLAQDRVQLRHMGFVLAAKANLHPALFDALMLQARAFESGGEVQVVTVIGRLRRWACRVLA